MVLDQRSRVPKGGRRTEDDDRGERSGMATIGWKSGCRAPNDVRTS